MAFALVFNRQRQAPLEESPAFAHVAERFRRAGDLQRAIALCRDGLRRFPDHVSARVTLGLALLDRGEYALARGELQQALQRAPDNLAAIRGLAHLHDHGEADLPLASMWEQPAEPAGPLAAAPAPAAPAAVVPDSSPAAAGVEPAATAPPAGLESALPAMAAEMGGAVESRPAQPLALTNDWAFETPAAAAGTSGVDDTPLDERPGPEPVRPATLAVDPDLQCYFDALPIETHPVIERERDEDGPAYRALPTAASNVLDLAPAARPVPCLVDDEAALEEALSTFGADVLELEALDAADWPNPENPENPGTPEPRNPGTSEPADLGLVSLRVGLD